MSKHTPGPWKWKSDLDMGGFHIYMDTAISNRSGYQCHHHLELDFTLYPEDGDQWEEAKANARLIAAAPELLEALTKKVQDAEQRMFEDWLEFNSPSGDHEAVQRQWLESNDYRGFIGEWREQLDAIANATGGTQ